MGSSRHYPEHLAALSDDVDCVPAVGHNPGLEDLLVRLTGTVDSLATAAIAHMPLRIESWRELTEGPRGRAEAS